MAFKDCVQSAINLAAEDTDAVIEVYDRYVDNGIVSGAASGAIADVIATVQNERQQTLDMIYEQHPDLAPETIPEAPELPETGITGAQDVVDTKQPAHALAARISDRIAAGDAITWQELFTMADEAYGGSQAEGRYTPKDAYDAMEMGLNLAILDSTDFFAGAYTENHQPKQREALNTLYKMMQQLPTQTKRTEEQDALQQYSTPPLHSFMAAWVSNLTTNDVVLEPSAGTGNLAVHALKAGVPNESIHVNELSDRRAGLLEGLFENVTRENASYINATLPVEVKPTVVIMNPPFSADVNLKGKKDQLLGAKHVEQALNRLEDGGRLVAILGRGMEPGRTRTRTWWEKIQKKHNVRANIQVSGEEYRKFGTTFDNQFVVIDKTGPTVGDIITGRVESVADLLPMIGDIRDDRVHRAEQPSAEPGIETETGRAESEAGRSGDLFTAAGETGARTEGERTAAGGRTRDRGDGRATDVGTTERGDELPAGERERGERDLQPAAAVEPAPVETGATAIAVDQAEDDSGVLIENADVTPVEIGTSSFEHYRSPLKITGAKPHPSKLAESAAMSAVKAPDVTYVPHIPRAVITSGKLSDVQLESIARAGQAHEITLPDGSRKGFFIGDGTGVGKGAQVAGIIIDNIAQGRKKAVWVSENQKLFEDAKRDTHWVGGNIKKLFQHSSVKGEIKAADGVLFTTYDTLRSKGKDIKDASGEVITPGKQRIDQVIDWLGEDFDGVIAFDEAHNMANALDQKGKRGIKKASMKALAGVDLQKRLPNARIIYVSATGATEVENLGYAERLGLWGEGTPFPDKSTFVNEIKAGGVAAMEVVAKDLKSMGVYTSRSLAYDDVEYSTIEHALTENQRFTYDELATAWQVVLDNVNEALVDTGAVTDEQTNGAAKSAAYSAFWGSHQRFFNQVLTGLQMPSVIDDIEIQLAAGKSAVLQLVNTNEAVQERRMNQAADAGITLDEVDITPRDILMQYVSNGFPVNQYEQYTDDDGNVRSRPAMDSQGNHIINPDAVEKRERMLDRIGGLEVPEGPLEQLINMFGSDAVAEITGRKRRLVRQADGTVKEEKLGAAKTKKDADEFMAGKKRILIFSDAGGTGRSYHASNTVKNQQQRIHYLVQPGWRADKAVQGTGRTHRTNQANAPHYKLVTTDIKAQRRFISTIARRLDQLGALTKGQRDTTSQGMFSADMNLEGEYGEAALQALIMDLNSGKVEGLTMADFIGQTGIDLIDEETGSINESKMPTVPKFLNRLLSMTIADMDLMFMEFYTRLEAVTEYAKEQGTYDSGMETVKADKISKIEERDVPERTTKYVKVELENPAVHVQFDQLPDDIGFARQKKSNKLFAFTKAMSMTSRSGDIVKRKRRVSPAGGTYVMESEFVEKYDEVQLTDEQARAEWDADLAKLSPVKKTTKHMITGELLSIWDRLPSSQPKIIRMITDDGEVLLGREISNKDMSGVLKALGLTVDVPKKTPAQWMAEVLNQGVTLTLSNGWQIVRRRVSGENRIEISGASFSEAEIVKNQGGFTERIAYQSRLFLPTEDAEVFARVISNKPVTDVFYPEGDAGVMFMRGEPGAAGMRVSQVQAIVDQIQSKYKGARAATIVVRKDDMDAFGKKIEGKPVKGGFDTATNTVTLLAHNLRSEADVLSTIRHELFTHFGIRQLFNAKELNEYLDLVRASRSDPEIAKVYESVYRDYPDLIGDPYKLAEEVVARIAERNEKSTLLDKIRSLINRMLRRLNLSKAPLSVAEVNMLIDKSAANLKAELYNPRVDMGVAQYYSDDTTQFARAYHGTPHRFDEFKTDKIGTGEGAQAYGYGLYFAENPNVAKSYQLAGTGKSDLQGYNVSDKAKELFSKHYPRGEARIGQLVITSPESMVPFLKRQSLIKDTDVPADLVAELKNATRAGTLYEVDIPDSAIDTFLDWDAPLSEQDALKQIDKNLRGELDEMLELYDQPDLEDLTGGELHSLLNRYASEEALPRTTGDGTNTKAEVAEYLNSLGIPGIKYLDQQSRGPAGNLNLSVRWGPKDETAEVFDTATDKAIKQFPTFKEADEWVAKQADEAGRTRNLVVFDESIIDIKSVNDQPMMFARQDPDYESARAKVGKKGGRRTILDHYKEVSDTLGLRFRQGVIDRYAALRELDDTVWKLARGTHHVAGAIEAQFKYGKVTLDKDGALNIDVNGKGLAETLAPLGSEIDDFLFWMIGNRANNLMQEGREHLFNEAEIAAFMRRNQGTMEDGRSRGEVYEQARKDMMDFQESILEIGIKTDTISREEADTWNKEFYIPFYRILEDEDGNERVRGAQTLDGLTGQTAIKRLKGGTKNLNDPLANILMNWHHVLSASMKNQAAAATVLEATEAGIMRPVSKQDKSKKAFFIRVNGQKHWFDIIQDVENPVVPPDLVLDALTMMNQPAWNNAGMRAMRKFKRVFTIGVTAAPEFRIANLIRDTLHSVAVGKQNYNLWDNVYQGWKGTKEGTDVEKRMMAGGGTIHFGLQYGDDPEAARLLIEEHIDAETILTDENGVKRYRHALKGMWTWWRDFGNRIENVNRAALYQKLRGEGVSHFEAAHEARDLLDFFQGGSWPAIRFLTQSVPFLNARLQGLDKMYRAGISPEQRKQLTIVLGAYITATLALYLLWRDDEDFKAREEWDRDSYHWFKAPGTDLAFRIPKPFEVGAIGTIAERALEYAIDDDVHGDLFAERLGHVFWQTFEFDPIPQMVRPALNIYANTDPFTNRPIESVGMERLSPNERRYSYTSETSIAAAKAYNTIAWEHVELSPIQVEYLVGGYLGWAGSFGMGAIDNLISRPIYEQELPFMGESRPERGIDEWPITRRFVQQLPIKRTKYTTMFYENLREVNQVYADMANYRKLGELEKARDIMEENRDTLGLRKIYNSASKKLSQINNQQRRVRGNKNLTAKQKKVEIDRLRLLKNAITEKIIKKTQAREKANK